MKQAYHFDSIFTTNFNIIFSIFLTFHDKIEKKQKNKTDSFDVTPTNNQSSLLRIIITHFNARNGVQHSPSLSLYQTFNTHNIIHEYKVATTVSSITGTSHRGMRMFQFLNKNI